MTPALRSALIPRCLPLRSRPRLRSRLLPLRHAVADAGLVEDVGGVVRAFAKLAAEVLYHGPYRPRMPGVSGAPQRLQQVIMGHDAAGVDRKLRCTRSACVRDG